jgi:hypothetical protein
MCRRSAVRHGLLTLLREQSPGMSAGGLVFNTDAVVDQAQNDRRI